MLNDLVCDLHYSRILEKRYYLQTLKSIDSISLVQIPTKVSKEIFALFLPIADLTRLIPSSGRDIDILSENPTYPKENTVNDGIMLEVVGK